MPRLSFDDYLVVAGEDSLKGKAVYIGLDGKLHKAIADSVETLAQAFTMNDVTQNNEVDVITNSEWEEFSGLTSGKRYYLSQTEAGEITDERPGSGWVQCVGRAKNSTTIDIHFSTEVAPLRHVVSSNGIMLKNDGGFVLY